MPPDRSFSRFSVLAPLVFFALIGDGTAMCALGANAPLAGRILMGVAIPFLTAALGAIILMLDKRGGRGGQDEDDGHDDWRRGGGPGPPPGDGPGPGGEFAWWPRFEAELQAYIRDLDSRRGVRTRVPA